MKSVSKMASIAIRRQAWRIASKKKSVWVDWAYRKSIKKGSFWDVEHPSNCSWGWRRILSARAAILPLVHHLIGNGCSTYFWLDPWLPCNRLIGRFGTNAISELGLGMNIPVSAFIGNGNWILPTTSSPYLIDIFTLVEVGPAPSVVFADEVVWKGSDHGGFCLSNQPTPSSSVHGVEWKDLI